jgi:hypothetical protein
MEGFLAAIIQFLEALESFYVVERDGSIILFWLLLVVIILQITSKR